MLPAKRTLYERLTHDMQHDHKVNKEVRMGKRVGFYKLKGQLGTGNFAKVKLGVHLLTTGKNSIVLSTFATPSCVDSAAIGNPFTTNNAFFLVW